MGNSELKGGYMLVTSYQPFLNKYIAYDPENIDERFFFSTGYEARVFKEKWEEVPYS